MSRRQFTRGKTPHSSPGITGWILLAVLVAAAAVSIGANGEPPLSLQGYFSYSYSVDLSTDRVDGGEVFYATVSGQATCTKDLPLTPIQVYVTSRIRARHDTTAAEIVLNPSYTVTFDTVPSKAGETAEETVTLPLSFPLGSSSGRYQIVAELVEARLEATVDDSGMIFVSVDIAGYLPSSQSVGWVDFTANSGGAIPGGSESVTEDADGLSAGVSEGGEFVMNVIVESSDGNVEVTIPSGTVGLTAAGSALSEMTITRMEEAPPPPDDAVLVLVYDIGPDGATFDRPVEIRLAYGPASLPDGVSEGNLVLAVWDGQAGEWTSLKTTVDVVGHTASAEITHFTLYSIVAGTRPARFVLSDLSVAPLSTGAGQTVVIQAVAANTGDLKDTYRIALAVDGVRVAVQEIPLAGGQERPVVFTASADTPGEYSLTLDTLSATFTVIAGMSPPAPASFTTSNLQLAPMKIAPGDTTSVSVLVTNTGDAEGTTEVVLMIDGAVEATEQVILEGGASTTVVFSVSREAPGAYTASVDDVAQLLVVVADAMFAEQDTVVAVATPATTSDLSGGLVGGIAGVTVVVVAGTFFLLRRRRSV